MNIRTAFKSVPICLLSGFVFLLQALTGCTAQVDALRKDMQTQLTEMRAIQAEQTAAIAELRSELRSVTGKVEEVQYTSQGRTQELEKTIQQLGSRVPPPPGVPEELLNRDDEKISAISGAAAEGFRDALVKLRAGDFTSARDRLQSFAETNPGTAFTDNALFWLGITYTKLNESDRAVVAFSDVLRQYPAEDMVPASLFYLGETFTKLGSNEDAQMTYQKLVDEHPRSEFAGMARGKIRGKAAPAKKKK